MRRRQVSSVLIGALGFALAGGVVVPRVSAFQEQAQQQQKYQDERIPEDEQEVLLSTVNFLVPEFDDDVEWLGDEQPTFESMRGDVVVLYTWNSETTDGRAMTRRVKSLLRPFEDENVHQIALHTPREAEEIVKKYARHSGKLPTPTAIDTKGAYLDELGIWEDPRIIVIGRSGAIRYAGVSLASLRDVVREALDMAEPAVAPEALPKRSERIDEGEAPKEAPEFPAHNRIQAGQPSNMQGKRGPALVVQEYLVGSEPVLEGKVLMIEFWFLGCPPCIAGIPHLNDLQAEFEGDLEIVGITFDQPQTIRNAMRTRDDLNFEYTVASDPTRRVQQIVGNRTYPHCIVMSSDGIVRWQGHPGRLTSQIMEAIVEANKGISGGTQKRWVVEDA